MNKGVSKSTKEIIKLVATLIVILIVVSVTLDPERGILPSSFNYITYAEPILLQRYLVSVISTASSIPGEYSSTIRTTGLSYAIKFYKDNDVGYVSIRPITTDMKTDFKDIEPMPVLTKCAFNTSQLNLEKSLSQTIFVQKTIEADGSCKFYFNSAKNTESENCVCSSWVNRACGGGTCADTIRYQTRVCPGNCDIIERCENDFQCTYFNFILGLNPPEDIVNAGSSVSTTVNISLVGERTEQVVLTAINLPTGITASFNPNNNCIPTCSETMQVFVDSTVPPGVYKINVTATSFELVKSENYSVIVQGCGDGIVQPPEKCDNTNFNGADCTTLGFGGGILSCKPDCNFDTSMCTATSFTFSKSCICSSVFCSNSDNSCTLNTDCANTGTCGPPTCLTVAHAVLVSNNCLGCNLPASPGCGICSTNFCASLGSHCTSLGGSCKYNCIPKYEWNGIACTTCGNGVLDSGEQCEPGVDVTACDPTYEYCSPFVGFGECTCMSIYACLKEGSLIKTPTGFRKIEELKVGDKVIGYKYGKEVESEILKTSSHTGNFTIYYYKGYWFTENHLVYLHNKKDFKLVSELSNITKYYKGNVYDITTETENYFGENSLLIHNKPVPV